jgi:RNA methyltransferase, TrmH family
MITSPDNEKLKLIRRLGGRRAREREGLFVAEGEDLVEMAAAAGAEPVALLEAGVDVEAGLLDAVSALGSGSRVIGIYRQRWSRPGGELSVYLDGVGDPGNVGTVIRSAHALADGPVILGPGCADPYSPKAVRASMGSLFARPPARAELSDLAANPLALSAHGAHTLREVEVEAPVVLCLGAERAGLPAELEAHSVRIATRSESLNVAMAATVALYDIGLRIAADA